MHFNAPGNQAQAAEDTQAAEAVVFMPNFNYY
jgi:hypothetical protein